MNEKQITTYFFPVIKFPQSRSITSRRTRGTQDAATGKYEKKILRKLDAFIKSELIRFSLPSGLSFAVYFSPVSERMGVRVPDRGKITYNEINEKFVNAILNTSARKNTFDYHFMMLEGGSRRPEIKRCQELIMI